MRYSILFVAVLILVSGFIAYFGDLLGRWLGKKRLTIGRLRPRHTAYAVTAITGMLISGMVVLTLVSVNSQFRKVFTQGEQILSQNESLAKANRWLEQRNRAMQVRGEALRAELEARRKDVLEARAAARKAIQERDKQLREVGRLRKEVTERVREIAARRRQLVALERQVDRLNADVVLTRGELRAKIDELARVQERLRIADSRLSQANARLADAEQKLGDTNAKLAEAAKELESTRDAISLQRDIMVRQHEAIKTIGKEKLKFEREALKFKTESDVLRSGRLVLRQGDEIVRGTISPKQSLFGIRADLNSILDSASERAKQLGAAVGANNRAVALVFRQPISDEYAVYSENETANIERAAESIARSPIEALVQVICARNSLKDEQVQVELMLYFNKLVYRKGDKIASTQMDGLASEGRILLSVIKFLQEGVSRAGLERGIIPIPNADSRATTGTNPQTQVEGLMTVVDQIRSKNARVTVDVYASADIYAAGPMNMDNMRFSVAKIK
jgi:uncharacterized protein (DUF3084 family)